MDVSRGRCRIVCLAGLACLAVAGPVAAVEIAPHLSESRPLTLRVEWGGGAAQAWAGSLRVVEAAGGRALPLEWRTLCAEPDAAAMAHPDGDAIELHQVRPLAADGVDLVVPRWHDARLVAEFTSAGGVGTAIDVALVDLLSAPFQQQLDTLGNRVTVKLAPGESLRVTPEAAAGGPPPGSVHAVGGRLRLRVDPLLAVRADGGTPVELRLRLRPAGEATVIAEQMAIIRPLEPLGGAPDRRPTLFAPTRLEVDLPDQEGVFEVDLEAVERGGLRWSRPLATRTVQFVALSGSPSEAGGAATWRTIHELDPGSPRLHERLRRFPGVGLASVGFPPMSLPAIPRPAMPLPRLPAVPLPDVAGMVPRLGGLLAAGHSVVAPHPLGPMLRLPPAESARMPAWEAIVVPNAEPGLPHAVEVDYPGDQDAVVGLAVLEADHPGGIIEPRHAGGFEVRTVPFVPEAAGVRTHRFVFWPTTKHPVLAIVNPSTARPALVGRVRVLVGPARLPAATSATDRDPLPRGAVARRATYAFFPEPLPPGGFGGRGRKEGGASPTSADWGAHLVAMRNSAAVLGSRGVVGAVVPVFAAGAAAWPSTLTRGAPRWDAATVGDAALDPLPKDLVGALVRVYARENLAVVPALTFDAPLPALEAALVAPDATGIACVGRDGRPRRLPDGSLHYNVLDPRVQAAVAAVVGELAARLRDVGRVPGVALLLPHDGWMHLPGLAWAIDDATFARFLAAVGRTHEPAPEGRFAERERLVEGPLRAEWIAWRSREVAAFHARLAAVVASIGPEARLHLVPTTLFAAGDLAARFRPRLGGGDDPVDVVREAGIDPSAWGAWRDRIVFVAPVAHAPRTGVLDDGAVAAANGSSALAATAAAAARRGVALVELPVELPLDEVASHAGFGGGGLVGPVSVRPAADSDRGLAEALAAVDAEFVFDMAVLSRDATSGGRRAFESLPGDGFGAVPTGGPLVVRGRQGGGSAWAQLIHAGPEPARAVLSLAGPASVVIDAVDGAALAVDARRTVTVPLQPWGVRALLFDGGVTVQAARLEHDDAVREQVGAEIESLRRRRAALESPAPLDVLDNPGFELGPAAADGGAATIAGWEVVEPRRGAVSTVRGADGSSRAVSFSSSTGLATLRSNPFAAPRSGRISVAAWLRLPEGDPQPPLRMAVEGAQDDREYYRFAAVGGLSGGRPLAATWSQFVLQVDDLPAEELDSLRVRFDLLGPGAVQIDDVRVFDLAFDESQRVHLTKALAVLDDRFSAGDVGGCVATLESHWPAFLRAFVPPQPEAGGLRGPAAPAAPQQSRQAGGLLDRVRGWW